MYFKKQVPMNCLLVICFFFFGGGGGSFFVILVLLLLHTSVNKDREEKLVQMSHRYVIYNQEI